MASSFRPAASNSLPPLGGRLIAAYRFTWWMLLILAFLAAGQALFDTATHPLILGLRLAKSIILIAVSAILFHRRKADPVAAMLGLSFLLWTASSSVDFTGSGLAWPILLDRCRFLLFAFALLLFPDGQWTPRWTRTVAVAILLVFLTGILEGLDLLPTRAFLPLAIGCVLLTLAALLARYHALPSVLAKQQLKWVALGLTVGIGLILSARAGAAYAAEMAMPMIGTIALEGLFQAGIVVIALGFLTSLLRYRLYDAETAISRSAAYAGLTLALVAIFAASESIIQVLGQRYFGSNFGDLSAGIAAASAAVLLTPLHGKMSSWAEQQFQRDLTGLKKEFPDFLTALSGGSSLARFGLAVLPRIQDAVHADKIALVVDHRLVAVRGVARIAAQSWLRSWSEPAEVELFSRSDDAFFPLKMALRCPFGSVRAWLLLGPRPDGSFYGQDDIDALRSITAPLQRAVFSVAERQTAQSREQRLRRAMATSIRMIEKRVSNLERNE